MYPSSSTSTTTFYSSMPIVNVGDNKMNNQFNTMTNNNNNNDCLVRRIKPSPTSSSKENRIHSGHFMVSEIDENDDNETKIENDESNVNNRDDNVRPSMSSEPKALKINNNIDSNE
ncbi:hypothetical protein BLA29_013684 [Euroglyphus maynei]|uniref:Uncharacterized protein n=1 Tax=Euroglyphus maynei TaxID=6958 RepID=A0A1Y3AYE7_EURMA|nr:hypothetical protein BLA29_013684 [Euroglyphus maynei]